MKFYSEEIIYMAFLGGVIFGFVLALFALK